MTQDGITAGWKVLLVDDDRQALGVYASMVREEGYGAVTAASCAEARRVFDGEDRLGLAVLDLKLPDGDGLELFRWVKERSPGLPVIILTGFGSIESAVRAVKEGAFHYLAKPPETEQWRSLVRSAVQRRVLEDENSRLRLRLHGTEGEGELLGRSEPMRDVYRMIRSVGPSQSAVLIEGESGTGKELAARSIHRLSARREGPFIGVNCGALPHNLLESELFGYEKGAFTGAASSRPGLFELADGGTIFLDEVGECSADLQVRLLRVLQEKEMRRVGGTRSVAADFRLVAATNRPLEEEVGEGRFREDLYYRINVISLAMPPLRARRDDIPLLAAFFLEKYSRREDKAVRGIAEEALDRMTAHHWPGNVRELENVVERGVVVCRGDFLDAGDLPPALQGRQGEEPGGLDLLSGDVPLGSIERAAMAATLRRHGGNKSQTARVLGISRKLLYSKIREYSL